MRFGYNKQADQRDQGRAQDLRTQARVRADMIREEIQRRIKEGAK